MPEEKRIIQGTVVSAKMDKTIVVELSTKVAHPLYGKYVKKVSKFHVHDPNNTAKEGDTVTFSGSRPFSKTKHWQLVDVLARASAPAGVSVPAS